jgi:glycosyltransferase involved in cell wall biosynthesis
MKVIYDISVLGLGYYHPTARIGIFRVMGNLAEELIKGKVISSFSSALSVGSYFECLDYLQSNPALHSVPLIQPGASDELLRGFQYLHTRTHMGAPVPFLKALRRLVGNGIANKVLSRNIMNHDALAAAEIFHSPFYPFPDQVKRINKLKKVITIYDLIPVLYPKLYGKNSNGLIDQILKSIDEDVWVTCISHATKNDLCNYLPALNPSRVFVTHLAASSMFYPCRDQAKIEAIKAKFVIPDGPYVLSLSTLEPRKNITQTIKCFSRLVEEESINDLSLVLVRYKRMGLRFDF